MWESLPNLSMSHGYPIHDTGIGLLQLGLILICVFVMMVGLLIVGGNDEQ